MNIRDRIARPLPAALPAAAVTCLTCTGSVDAAEGPHDTTAIERLGDPLSWSHREGRQTVGGFSVGVGLGYFFGIEEVDEIVGVEHDAHGVVSVEDARETTSEARIDLHYGWRAPCPFAGCAFGPYVAFNADPSGVRTHAYGWSLQFRDRSIGTGRGTRENVRHVPDEPAFDADDPPEVHRTDLSALMALVSARF